MGGICAETDGYRVAGGSTRVASASYGEAWGIVIADERALARGRRHPAAFLPPNATRTRRARRNPARQLARLRRDSCRRSCSDSPSRSPTARNAGPHRGPAPALHTLVRTHRPACRSAARSHLLRVGKPLAHRRCSTCRRAPQRVRVIWGHDRRAAAQEPVRRAASPPSPTPERDRVTPPLGRTVQRREVALDHVGESIGHLPERTRNTSISHRTERRAHAQSEHEATTTDVLRRHRNPCQRHRSAERRRSDQRAQLDSFRDRRCCCEQGEPLAQPQTREGRMGQMVRCVHDVVAHLLGPPIRRRLGAPRARRRDEQTEAIESHIGIMPSTDDRHRRSEGSASCLRSVPAQVTVLDRAGDQGLLRIRRS